MAPKRMACRTYVQAKEEGRDHCPQIVKKHEPDTQMRHGQLEIYGEGARANRDRTCKVKDGAPTAMQPSKKFSKCDRRKLRCR